MRRLRGQRNRLVPQSPLAALIQICGSTRQLEEAWRAHVSGRPDWEALLESVSLPAEEELPCLYPEI